MYPSKDELVKDFKTEEHYRRKTYNKGSKSGVKGDIDKTNAKLYKIWIKDLDVPVGRKRKVLNYLLGRTKKKTDEIDGFSRELDEDNNQIPYVKE